jgi:hypothetical protein
MGGLHVRMELGTPQEHRGAYEVSDLRSFIKVTGRFELDASQIEGWAPEHEFADFDCHVHLADVRIVEDRDSGDRVEDSLTRRAHPATWPAFTIGDQRAQPEGTRSWTAAEAGKQDGRAAASSPCAARYWRRSRVVGSRRCNPSWWNHISRSRGFCAARWPRIARRNSLLPTCSPRLR